MFLNRRNAKPSRIVAWLTGFAILIGTLAPSFTYALAPHQVDAGRWSEICTALGIQLVKVNDGESSDPVSSGTPDTHGLSGEHCLFCQVNSSADFLPLSPIALFVSVEMQRMPRLFYHSPHPLHNWMSAYPRAPPVLS